MTHSITEILNVTRDPPWAPWAVQYFFLIGLSVGCFLLTLPGVAFARKGWEEASRMALLGALVCGFSAPVALLSDLHGPGRFLNFYLYPQSGSWMSWGSFFLVAYTGLLPVYAWLALAPEFRAAAAEGGLLALPRRLLGGPAHPGLVRALGMLTLIAAALVALYTGMETMIVRARVLWNTPLLPFEMIATALAGAIGLTLLLARAFGSRDGSSEALLNRLLALVLAFVAALGVWWVVRAHAGDQSSEAIAWSQIAGSRRWDSYALWAMLSVGAPLLTAALRPRGTGLFTGLLAVQAAWAFRWILFVGGQDIPKTGAGIYHSPIAFGPEGWVGMVGTAGLWIVIFIALTMLLPWSAGSRAKTSVAGA
jgi:tetrathionate reductase subunit C